MQENRNSLHSRRTRRVCDNLSGRVNLSFGFVVGGINGVKDAQCANTFINTE